jgi:hypothetical protein
MSQRIFGLLVLDAVLDSMGPLLGGRDAMGIFQIISRVFLHASVTWYLFGRALELVRIQVLPNFLHVIPSLHDAVFHWILDGQQPSQLLRSLPNVSRGSVLSQSSHDGNVFGPSNADTRLFIVPEFPSP